MWEGVPPGCSLIGRYEPGEMRYYMGDDGSPRSSSCRRRGRRVEGPGRG